MLNKINVLVTGAGAPGIQGTIYSLRNNFDKREIYILGTDAKENVVGKFICDDFATVPPAKENGYLDSMLQLCEKKCIDVLIPQNTAELLILSKSKTLFDKIGTKILVSDFDSINSANDKYNLFNVASNNAVPTTKYAMCSNFMLLRKYVNEFMEDSGMAVVKPPISNGSRGVRVIAASRNRKKDFYAEKPNNLFTTLDELYEVLGDEFPPLLVMEYLPGDEYTVDVFRSNDDFYAIPRKREVIRSGITFAASLVKDERIIEYSKSLSESCGLSLCFGFQFKLDCNNIPRLLESNPRIQGTMVMSTFSGANIIYMSVKALLGETNPKICINWSTRLLRYWGAIGINGNEFIRI